MLLHRRFDAYLVGSCLLAAVVANLDSLVPILCVASLAKSFEIAFITAPRSSFGKSFGSFALFNLRFDLCHLNLIHIALFFLHNVSIAMQNCFDALLDVIYLLEKLIGVFFVISTSIHNCSII